MSPTSTPHAGADTAVRHVANRELATVEPDATVQDVAEELALDEIGVVLVQYVHDPIGLISERDLVTVVAAGGDLERQASDLMSVDLVSVPAETTIAEVARLMLDARIRHVLVRDTGDRDDPDDGPVIGIVSMRDVVAVLLDDVR
jgi:CBS domain-containing protein